MTRAKHPKPEVEEALADIEGHVRIDVRQNGHVWAWLFCPCGKTEHKAVVHSTPQNPGNHANKIRGMVARWQQQDRETQPEKEAQAK